MADLMNDVASAIPAKWRAVGIQLGLSSDILDDVKSNNAGSPDACLNSFEDVLSIWKRHGPRPYTWKAIIDVLSTRAVGYTSLADELGTKYRKSLS